MKIFEFLEIVNRTVRLLMTLLPVDASATLPTWMHELVSRKDSMKDAINKY